MRQTPSSSTATRTGSGRRHRLLTAAEERELAQAIEAGRAARERRDGGADEAGDDALIAGADRARNEFIECNIRLVQSVANGFHLPSHVDRQDAAQDGMLGLERAVERFDWRRGYKFSTYATWWIRQAIQRGLETTSTTIRIPAHRSRELRSAHAAAVRASGDESIGLPPDLQAIDLLSSTDSTDRPIGDVTLGSLLASDDEGTDEVAMRRVLDEQVRELVDGLDQASRFAVRARFGLGGLQPQTYAVIGQALGVTPQAARRRVERALERLRENALELAA